MSTENTMTHDELRRLFLFEHLTAEQLDWISANSRRETFAAGATVVAEGDPATCFYVLLGGTMSMSRLVSGSVVEITRSDQVGSYFGATQFLVDGKGGSQYSASVTAISDLSLLSVPAAEFSEKFREWFPMATHLLSGMYLGWRNSDAVIGQRQRLQALGELSAGLTHELNNPAAAAVRATAALRERVAGMRNKLAMLAKKDINPGLLESLIEVQENFVKKVPEAPKLTALQQTDLEDEITDWLDDHDIRQGWDMADTFVNAGLTTQSLEDVAVAVGEDFLEPALRWLGYALETEMLMGEIEDSTTRVSTLVAAAKQYSQMDRAPFQWIDVHDGLDSTLVMLNSKFEHIKVEKDYDRSLPSIPAYAGELNQVWTNLVDNAVSAMEGRGTLTLRTSKENECVLVEIGDTGPGVPDDIKQRIFEPFFTTKPVGEGTGLGLDISWRIVVNRHHGDLRVRSVPGNTVFQVRLPLTESPDT
ncbi:ATP-binding protein [Labedaea rhizosphaerae]|uniref:histidine kinase n=1 Tax=Labedaea rhizosphaerae TaxID=598644 RepID=A0A4R6SK12_LABRH|nr:ATP-binding protein [Labedaea rhizosphaerae]TDQ01358.1 cyclic nucleotide-binding protein [Labedaea rhizosphaerae]